MLLCYYLILFVVSLYIALLFYQCIIYWLTMCTGDPCSYKETKDRDFKCGPATFTRT